MELATVFFTGLLSGGLTCLAVQGGLLATSLAQQAESTVEKTSIGTEKILPLFSFLITRLLGYTLVGLLLGSAGSVVQLSITTRILLQFLVSVFMIGTALNLLQAHPIFRYFIIQPPKFLTKMIRNQSKSQAVFGPALLGAMTIFIPCGATQAMMAYALSTSSPTLGALVMFTFILGTSPLFVLLGVVAKGLEKRFSFAFNKIAAAVIIIISLYSINGALALAGSPITIEKVYAAITCSISFCNKSGTVAGAVVDASTPVTKASIFFTRFGYETDPDQIVVKKGSTVTLDLVNKDGGGCIQAFTIPKLNLQKIVSVGSTETITITAPNQAGELAFMCSMGMYTGAIKII